MIDNKEWKQDNLNKKTNIKELLEKRASENPLMDQFNLEFCNLENVTLINKNNSKNGITLTNSKLYKSNFHKAHCFNINLSGSNLMKADFSYANLHCANLTNCNLLGTNFQGARLENITWDKEILQEKKAKESNNIEESNDFYQQAEEIYRNLRKSCENSGLFENAGNFFQKEMRMRRKKMPLWSMKRIFSKLVEISCGYGERPMRIIIISIFTMFLFSFLYFLLGIKGPDGLIQYSELANSQINLENFLNSLYFSVVTFTTLGYGDITPIGLARVVAGVEALLGGFILAIFVVVFVKKMTR